MNVAWGTAMTEDMRINGVVMMALRPGYLRLRFELPALPTGTVRIGPHVADEVPIELVPIDLRPLGSRVTVTYGRDGQPIAVEKLLQATDF
jgi:hypothetical protein